MQYHGISALVMLSSLATYDGARGFMYCIWYYGRAVALVLPGPLLLRA